MSNLQVEWEVRKKWDECDPEVFRYRLIKKPNYVTVLYLEKEDSFGTRYFSRIDVKSQDKTQKEKTNEEDNC